MKPNRPVEQLTFLFGTPSRQGERVARPDEPSRRVSRVATAGVSAPAPHADAAHRLASELRLLVAGPLTLRIHDNRSTMVSFRREADELHLRIHHMFLTAGPEVVRALAEYAKQRSPRAGKVLDGFVRQHRSAIKPVDAEKRHRDLQAQGSVYDLQAMYDRLNARYFGDGVNARIGWGRGTTEKRRRSIRMGAYFHETATILMHPALDRAEVPRYFVELVVYHEMLHQAVPHEKTAGGRRCIHSPEFRRREKLFEQYELARTWERHNLSVLLRPAKPTRGRG